MFCPNCGNQCEGNFCTKCGYSLTQHNINNPQTFSRLDADTTVSEYKHSFLCKNCNTIIPDSFKKCPNCGAKIRKKKKLYQHVLFWIVVILFVCFVLRLLAPVFTDNGSDIDTYASGNKSVNSTTTQKVYPDTWIKKYYVDEFKQETDEWYVAGIFYGTFSNSATTDSALRVAFLIDEENMCIKLYEYDSSSEVINIFSEKTTYTITIKDEHNNKTKFNGWFLPQGDRLVLDPQMRNEILDILKAKENVSFYIVSNEYSVDSYLFTVFGDNFASVWSY